MPWDDLHEKKGPEKWFRGGGGGGSSGKPPFEIPQLKIPKIKPSLVLGLFARDAVLCRIWSSAAGVRFGIAWRRAAAEPAAEPATARAIAEATGTSTTRSNAKQLGKQRL